MPIVQVKMLGGRTPEQKKALAEEVTQALVRTIDTSADQVNVLIEEYQPEDWAFAGVLFSERRAASDSGRGAEG